MSHRTNTNTHTNTNPNASVLASSAMSDHHPHHSHSEYYHEIEDDLASSRHPQSRSYEPSRTYDQHQQHQFSTRLSGSGLAQSTVDEIGSVGGTGNGGATGGGGIFYPPSTFAPGRMAAQQYSAAPGPGPTSQTTAATTTAYQSEYMDSEMPPPPSSATSAGASAYYGGSQSQTQTQYGAPPTPTSMSSLQSSLHSHPHAHGDATLLSAEMSGHHIPSSAPPPSSSSSAPSIPPSTSLVGPTTSTSTASAIATRPGPPGSGPTDPPSPTSLAARRHATSDIGKWKTFASGPFAGRTVRAEIKEVQKADLGRKCADPPTGTSMSTGSGGAGTGGAAQRSASGSAGAEEGRNLRLGNEREHERESTAGKDKPDGETKAVRKDRRPLDPPPVVELKLFESIHDGTPHQYERPIPSEEVEIGGLICQVDLYRVTIPPSPTEVASLTLAAHPGGGIGPAHGQAFGAYGHGHGGIGMSPVHTLPHHQHHHPNQSPYDQHGFTYPPSKHHSMLGTEDDNPSAAGAGSGASPLDTGWESASPISPVSPYTYHSHPAPHHAHHHAHPTLNTHVPTLSTLNSPSPSAPINPDALPPPLESDKLTRVLFGESYAHACSILDLSGKPTIYFVFADLSVKLEGLFRPRYRFFDLFSRTAGSSDVPVLAQCFGGAFAVYSTKEFPGLKASTPLTKHLSRWGIRVNIRETERKRRAPAAEGGASGNGGNSSSGGAGAGARAGKGKEKRKGGRNGSGGGRKVTRGGSVGTAGASSSASVRGEDEGEGSSPVTIPRGVDAPRRYLEGAAKGRGGRARTTTAGSSTGETRGRGKQDD